MSKELKGYTNRLLQNPDGTISKFFRDEGITSRSSLVRKRTESSLLRKMPLTPRILDEKPHEIKITELIGEKDLDTKIDEMSERIQISVFKSAGSMLRFIHDYHRTPLPLYYIDQLVRDSLARTNKIEEALKSLSINPQALREYFVKECDRKEIEKWGLCITHGDYWLNNIIGRIDSDFELSGIIDWEMGGVGSPYNDFAVVSFSIEKAHPFSIESFWEGYGVKPNSAVKNYFCARQIVLWISEDGDPHFDSDFYKTKVDMLRESV